MADNTMFSNLMGDNIQCTLSYELMCLLRWLTEQQEPQLKAMIKKAMSSGLKKELRAPQHGFDAEEEAQLCIVDFFNTMEALLFDVIDEQTMHTTVQQHLMPTLGHIDTDACDSAIVASSVEKVVAQMETKPVKNPQQLLFQEILKQWKPQKKSPVN